MIDRIVGLYRTVSIHDLKELTRELGGEWHEWSGGCQGSIQDGEATVWCHPPQMFDEYYHPEDDAVERESIRRRAERDVVEVLTVAIGHGEGSDALASRVIEFIVGRWGGTEIKDEWFEPLEFDR